MCIIIMWCLLDTWNTEFSKWLFDGDEFSQVCPCVVVENKQIFYEHFAPDIFFVALFPWFSSAKENGLQWFQSGRIPLSPQMWPTWTQNQLTDCTMTHQPTHTPLDN